MSKREWLQKLENEMSRIGVFHFREITRDYEEHFNVGVSQGKTETEIAAKLGDPLAVARAHHAETLVTKVQSSSGTGLMGALSAALRLLILTPFNFFMLIGPFLITIAFLVTGWVTCLVSGAVSVAAVVVTIVALSFLFMNFWGTGAFIFGSLGFIGATILGLMLMWLITRWIVDLFISYLKWNVNFVLEK